MNKVCELHGNTLEERFDNNMKIVLVCVYCQLDEALATIERMNVVRVRDQEEISEQFNALKVQRDEARDASSNMTRQATALTKELNEVRATYIEYTASLRSQLDEARAELESAHGLGAAMMAERDEARAELAHRIRMIWGMDAQRDSLIAERDALRAAIEALQADMRVMWGWGDPCDMTLADQYVWDRYHDPDGYGFRLPPSAAPAASRLKPVQCKHGVMLSDPCCWCDYESENEAAAALETKP